MIGQLVHHNFPIHSQIGTLLDIPIYVYICPYIYTYMTIYIYMPNPPIFKIETMNTTKIFLIAKVGKKQAGGWNSRVSGQTTRISFKTGNSQKEDLYNGKAAQNLWISIPIPRYPIPFPVFFKIRLSNIACLVKAKKVSLLVKLCQ